MRFPELYSECPKLGLRLTPRGLKDATPKTTIAEERSDPVELKGREGHREAREALPKRRLALTRRPLGVPASIMDPVTLSDFNVYDADRRVGPNFQASALARASMPTLRKAPIIAVTAPPYLARSFTCAAGSRDYKVYVPSRAEGRALPLIVMLHGCTQQFQDFSERSTSMRISVGAFIPAAPFQAIASRASRQLEQSWR